MLFVEFLSKSHQKIIVFDWICDLCKLFRNFALIKKISNFRPIIQMLCTKSLWNFAGTSFKISLRCSLSGRFSTSETIRASIISLFHIHTTTCIMSLRHLIYSGLLLRLILWEISHVLFLTLYILWLYHSRSYTLWTRHPFDIPTWEGMLQDWILDWCLSLNLIRYRLFPFFLIILPSC